MTKGTNVGSFFYYVVSRLREVMSLCEVVRLFGRVVS